MLFECNSVPYNSLKLTALSILYGPYKDTMKPNTNTHNVDPHEVQKFDDLAIDWWDLQGQCKPLHDLNPLRLAFMQSCCPLAQQDLLDVGCGGGILSEALSRFTNVVGLDQSQKALEVARTHAQTLPHPPEYIFATVEEYALRYPGKFDIITCMEMLEHVPSPLSVIEACATLLKPKGHLFFSTLNRTPKSFLHAIVGAEYVLNMLPKGTHEYARFIRPSELHQWARPHHLVLKQMKGISFKLLTRSYALSDDVSVNYLMHFQKE